ncbi:MAG: hypothetical protein ACYTG4_01470 [Planctomycetota bacterium]
MTTRYYCMWKGRRLFRVLSGRQELFCGSLDECQRYIEIHKAKEEKARLASLRTPRRRVPTFRIFRMAPRRARTAS